MRRMLRSWWVYLCNIVARLISYFAHWNVSKWLGNVDSPPCVKQCHFCNKDLPENQLFSFCDFSFHQNPNFRVCVEELIVLQNNEPDIASEGFIVVMSKITRNVRYSEERKVDFICFALLCTKMIHQGQNYEENIDGFCRWLEFGNERFLFSFGQYYIDFELFVEFIQRMFPTLYVFMRTIYFSNMVDCHSRFVVLPCDIAVLEKVIDLPYSVINGIYRKSDGKFPLYEALEGVISEASLDNTLYFSETKQNIGFYSLFLVRSKDKTLIDHENKIRDVFPYHRAIRGDGNCYFRSVIFRLIEQIIERDVRHNFAVLKDIFQDFEASIFFDEAHKNIRWKSAEDFIREMNDKRSSVDDILIRDSRKLLSKYICTNESMVLENGMMLRDMMEVMSGDPFFDMKKYCRDNIEKLGELIPDLIADAGLMWKALKCCGYCVCLDKRSKNVNMLSWNENKEENLGSVHL